MPLHQKTMERRFIPRRYFRHVRMLIVTVANALETDRTGHPIHDQWDWFHSWRKPGFGVTVTERKGRLNVKNVDVTSG